ncbi:MAG: hypothetical protein K2O42_10675 [Oscillospiraceae bacterium]|nr:hypothetical protein [Oscillospiraceae bacterium]
MQREEFESLTGFRPTQGMYRVIANKYIKSKQDVAEFCRQYSLNIGGIAEKIQRIADTAEIEQQQESETRIAELQEQLDKELKWKYCAESGTCLGQEEYTEMLAESQTVPDETAVKILSLTFGLMPEKIRIRHEVQDFERNKYGQTRVKRTFQRSPIYDDSDCNYIRLDCAGRQWELVNGELLEYDH